MSATTAHDDNQAARCSSLAVEQDRDIPEVLVVFRLGSLRLGIDVRQVGEVARAMAFSAPPPNAAGVAGLLTLRGKVVAVVDLSVVLGIPGDRSGQDARMVTVRHDDTTTCLLVDGIDGLHEVSAAELEPAPPALGRLDASWLDSITRSAAGELIGIVDVDRLLSLVSLPSSTKDQARV